MSLTILLLLAFMLLLLFCGWRNKYFVLFSALAAAMAVSMSTLMMEVAKSSNYLVPARDLVRPLETRLYILFRTWAHIPLSTLMVIRNAGIAAYLIVLDLFVLSFSRSVRLDEKAPPKRTVIRFLLMVSFPVLFFLFYHPQTAFLFFRQFHTHGAQGIDSLLRTLNTLFTCAALLYLLWPVFFLLYNYRRGRMTFLSGFLLRLAGPLLVLNISFFILFFTGLFRPSVSDALHYGFWRFTLPTQLPAFYTSVLPVITFVLLVAALIALMQLHADYILTFFKFRGIRKNLDALYSNVRNVMHSEKNLLFTIQILIREALEEKDEAEREKKLQNVLAYCGENMDSLTDTLNNVHDMNLKTLRSDFIAALEAAIAGQRIPDTVRVERDYPSDTLPLLFDMYHMTHAIGNLLSNCLDALNQEKPEKPLIRVTVYASTSWVYLSVWDNGCGIPANILHKVIQPRVSTKNKKNSWGIGLSYVYSVIRAHYGQMRIRSRQHQFTQVEILLPRSDKRR